jgi:hypothetical protein
MQWVALRLMELVVDLSGSLKRVTFFVLHPFKFPHGFRTPATYCVLTSQRNLPLVISFGPPL